MDNKNEGLDILRARFKKGEIDRRLFLTALGALGAASALSTMPAFAQEKRLTLATWGGDTSKAIERIFASGFESATKISVRDDTSGPTEGAIQAQAQAGRAAWDVMQIDYFSSITLGKKGFLSAIDYNIVAKDKIVAGQYNEWAAACFLNAYLLVFDTKTFGSNPPKNWVDFFDVEKFPGKRTIPKNMMGLPEAALLADGVDPKNLYPLDLDRAFRKIKALLPDVSTVWNSPSESQQIMIDGDAVMGLIPATRAILVDRETDQQVTFTFTDGILFSDAWAIMKDNPAGAEAANKFIAWTQAPELQVELLKAVGFGPLNPAAAAMVPEELKRTDCSQPEHLKVMHTLNIEWYAENYAAALDQYTAVISG